MLDTATYTPRLKTAYKDSIRAALKEEFGYKNEMMIPKLEKKGSLAFQLIFLGNIPGKEFLHPCEK